MCRQARKTILCTFCGFHAQGMHALRAVLSQLCAYYVHDYLLPSLLVELIHDLAGSLNVLYKPAHAP